MADRPTPQSVAVCALILALLEDESPPTPPTPEGKDEREHRETTVVGGRVVDGVVTLPDLVRRLIVSPSSPSSPSPAGGWEEEVEVEVDGGDGMMIMEESSSSCSSSMRLLSSTLLPPPGDGSGGQRSVPESAARAFRDTLDGCCKSIDDLVDFFDRLRSKVGSGGGVGSSSAGGAVDRESSHGLYLRRQCLGFDTLSFEAVGRLWMALREYVEDARRPRPRGGHIGVREGEEKDESFADAGQDEAMGNADADAGIASPPPRSRSTNWPQSPKQIEGAIQRLCLSFDRTVLGCRSSAEIESEIRKLLADHPELPALHFLRFLNHLHHGERVGALESLHRYFDYAMIRERRIALSQAAAAAEAAAAAAASSEGEESKQGDSTAAAHQAHLLGSATGSVVQYASIELAALYREFRCDSLASRATEEAVRVAQQDRDDDCVAYALGWLPSPTSSSPSSSGGAGGTTTQVEELLRRCIARSSASSSSPNLSSGEGSSSGLASGASLVLARHMAATSTPGSPRSPREIWDCLASASAGPSVSAGSGGGAGGAVPSAGTAARTGGAGGRHQHHHHHHRGPPVDQPVHLPPGCHPVEALTVPARCQLVASGVWETFGHTSLASSSAATALHCHGGDTLSCGDYVSSVHGIATASLVGVSHSTGFGPHSGDDGGGRGALSLDLDAAIGTVPLSLPHRRCDDVDEEEKLDGGDDAPHDEDHCAYSLALRKLIDLRRRYGGGGRRRLGEEDELHLPAADVWVHAVSLLLHERAVARGDYAHARALGFILHGSVPSSRRSPEAHVQSIGQYALLLYRQGWYDRAASVTSDVIDFCGKRGLHVPRARLLLQLASIRLESTTGMCGGGTSSRSMSIGGVLPPLLECMSLSECLSMDALHASASAVLARVHLALGTVGRARALLRSCMPLVLAHAPLALQGEAWMTLAKCHMREAADRDRGRRGDGTCPPPPRRRRALRELHLALSQVEEALPLFRRCGDFGRLREALYLRARLCHALFPGDHERRNEAAAEFRELSSRIVGATCVPAYYDVMASIASTSELERVARRC